MPGYADTSFLVRAYTPHADSQKALAWLQHAREPLPFTALHRHELRNAIRLRVPQKMPARVASVENIQKQLHFA